MFAGPCDGQEIEQLEIIEAEHLQEMRRLPFSILQSEPPVELKLCLPNRCLNARNSVCVEGFIIRLRDECDLILKVGQAVVDWRGGKHEDPRLHAIFYDAPHQPVVASLTFIVSGFVPEVVRLVYDYQVIIAPVHVAQIDVARNSGVTG